MRFPKKMASLALALTGVTWLAVETVEAGLPTNCSICTNLPETSRIRGPHTHRAKKKVGHLCADCAARMQATGMTPPPMVASTSDGACTACGTADGAAPSAPGYASIGDGSPSPMLAAGGAAPGYAIVGGTVVSSEPTPIGVMRTNYHSEPMAPGSLGASVANARGGAPGVAGIPFAQPNELPPTLYAPQRPRRSVLARLIGLPSVRRHRAEAEARQRESHAMTSYGTQGGSPTELPASMVYGGR